MHSLNSWRVTNRKLRAASLTALALLLGIGVPASAQDAATPRAALPYDTAQVNRMLGNARFLGHQSPQTPVNMVIMLPLSNQAALKTELQQISDPTSPNFRHYRTPQQFAAKYGPADDDVNAAIKFAQSAGLTITGKSRSRTLIDVQGTTDAVETAFGVRINRYLMPNGRVSYAAMGIPSAPQSLLPHILGIGGFDNLGIHHHHHQVKDALSQAINSISPHVGNGPAGGLAPADVHLAYNVPTNVGGEGQSVAVYELDGYNRSDIYSFTSSFNIPTPTLIDESVDGYDGSVQEVSNEEEVVLDIDMVLEVAPKIGTIYVYQALDQYQTALDEWQKIADDDLASVVSTSWGTPEDSLEPASTTTIGEAAAENQIFEQMADQGQTVFDASGDNGAYDDTTKASTPEVDDPASQPYVTGVGGTTLTLDANGDYGSETVWDNSLGASGGGVSTIWPKPSYQKGIIGEVGVTSVTNREVPDVALDADPNTGYDIFVTDGGGWITVGGTSAAAPLWAGFAALVNEQLNTNGSGPLGFLNPTIYAIGQNATEYAADFHDITSGNNGDTSFAAHKGYDDSTGWGTFSASALLNQVVVPANSQQSGLVGKVLDAAGHPLSGVSLSSITITATVTATNQVATSTVPIADGAYTLFLQTGVSYTITASAPGYTSQSFAGITVPDSQPLFFYLSTGYTYNEGLQMISAPYEFSGIADFSQLFGIADDPPIPGTDPLMATYLPTEMQYVETPVYPADTIHNGVGYWVDFSTQMYLHATGTPAPTTSNFQIILEPGWNMIGDPFTAPVPVSSLSVISGSTTVPISPTTSVPSTFYTWPGPTVDGSTTYQVLGLSGSLQPYVGYWVHNGGTTSATLVIPPPS